MAAGPESLCKKMLVPSLPREIGARSRRGWRGRYVKAENIHLPEIHARKSAEVADDFVEWIIRRPVATRRIKKVARVRIHAKVSEISDAAIDRKICGRRKSPLSKQVDPRAAVSKEVQAISVYAAHGVGDFVKSCGDQNITGEGCTYANLAIDSTGAGWEYPQRLSQGSADRKT
jgi:hypothetical protein